MCATSSKVIVFDPAICDICASCSIPRYVLTGYMSKTVPKC